MKRTFTIARALDDPEVFGSYFKAGTWRPWRVFLAALFGLPLTPDQLAIYRKHTGRGTPPTTPLNEAWLCIGRRGGKSFVLAVIATYLATFKDWRPYLGPGEVATIMIVARDRRQARVIKRFITGMLHEIKMLRATVQAETQESIQLKNRVSIEIHTASFRSTRGYTIVAALLDEIAYWETDEASAEPDVEVINAIKPGMATIPGAMLLCASSPHARRGALWDAYRQHFGQDGDDVLVWQAATRDMNARVPQSYIDKHIADDPARAAAEYGAVFRTDIEAFVAREVVEAAVISGRRELPFMSGTSYVAFVDPSGGSASAFTLAIAHRDKHGHVVLDCVRERKPPFSPEAVVAEFCVLLKSYGITKVTGDRFAGEWPRERFRVHGIEYIVAEKAKADLYRDLLPILNGGRSALLDHPRLIGQLCHLERNVTRTGREQINPPPGAMDDLANAVAGALVLALVAVPSLWAADAFLVGDAPAALPRECMLLFAVIVADKNGRCGIAYFLPQLGRSLLVLDWGQGEYLTPAVLTEIPERLSKFSAAVHAHAWFIYTTKALEQEFRSLGIGNVEAADAVISDDDGLLRLAVAKHVIANKVKVVRRANSQLTSLLEMREENPLTTALMVGIVLALDPGRTLTKSRAA